MRKKAFGIRRLMLIGFHAAPAAMLAAFVLNAGSGLLPVATTLATASFIDTAMAVLAGSVARDAALRPILAAACVVALQWFSQKWMDIADRRLALRLQCAMHETFTDKCARLTYAHIENPESWDVISRVTRQPEKDMCNGISAAFSGMRMALCIIGLATLLLANVWWSVPVIAGFSVPMVMLGMRAGKANYQAERETEREERLQKYLRDMLTSREAAEERAMFGYTEAMRQKYRAAFERAWRKRFRTEARFFVQTKLGGCLFALVSILIALTLIFPTADGTLSIGLFTSLAGTLFSMVNMLSWELTEVMDSLAKAREYMKDVSKLEEMEEMPGALDAPQNPPMEFSSLELKDVSFAYPGTEKKVLDRLSLRIKAGEHVAFVGVNGAGKTTLTKLLTGLYDNYDGEILVNGRELRTLSQAQLKSLFAVVFQDFSKYEMTFAQNVTAELPGRSTQAARSLGLDIGDETQLGKLYKDGRELSGGQWQRVAIARALSNPAPVRILDEPTSALDPMAESEIYRHFQQESRHFTTLFISHRLGSTKLANRICVLSEGRMLEEGTHEELMARNGLYARMFEAQREWYA